MPIRHNAWYDLTAQRGDPLADSASGVDADGLALPPDIIVGCNVRFPETLARFAYVAAVTVTSRLCTVALAGCDQPIGAPAAFRPLGCITAVRPIRLHHPYAIEPLADGVGGWIVLGPGAEGEPYAGRFGSPDQSLLLRAYAAPYPTRPVASLGKERLATALSGEVVLEAGGDLAMAVEDVEIVETPTSALGLPVRAAVFRLTGAPGVARNVLDIYTGPCGGRPESQTCALPSVTRIGDAAPDLDGVLTLELRGAVATPLADHHGFVIDLAASVEAACARDEDALDGLVADRCEASESEEPEPSEPSEPSEPDPGPCVGPPYAHDFAAASVPPDGWTVVSGKFVARPAGDFDAPDGSWSAAHAGTRSVAIYAAYNNCGDEVATNKRTRCKMLMIPGLYPGGGIVVNYVHSNTAAGPEYFLVGLDALYNSVSVWRRAGGRTRATRQVLPTSSPPITTGIWYELDLEVRDLADESRLEFTLRVDAPDEVGFPQFTFTSYLEYEPGEEPDLTGVPGVGAFEAETLFRDFSFEDL